MAQINVLLEGWDQIRRRISDAAERERLTQKLLNESAVLVQERAREQAPVRTGNLRRSIFVEQTEPLERAVGPLAPYGKFVEFGTEHMQPRPFMRPGLERARPQIAELLERLAARVAAQMGGGR